MRRIYNAEENLWLLCGACNKGKIGKDMLEWFVQHSAGFGPEFIKYIESLGGVHVGIILKTVYNSPTNQVYSTDMPDTPSIEIDTQAQRHGLGKLAVDWYIKKHQKEFDLFQEYYKHHYARIQGEVEKIIKFTSDQEKEKEDSIKKLKFMIKEGIKALSHAAEAYDRRKKSPSNSEQAWQDEDMESANIARGNATDMLARLREVLTQKYAHSPELVESIKKYIKRLANLVNFDGAQLKELFSRVSHRLEDTSLKTPSLAELGEVTVSISQDILKESEEALRQKREELNKLLKRERADSPESEDQMPKWIASKTNETRQSSASTQAFRSDGLS